MDVHQNRQSGDQRGRRRVKHVILELEQRGGDQPREGGVQRNRHTAAHGRQQALHHPRVKTLHLPDGQQHEDKTDDGAEQPQPQERIADEMAERVPVRQLIAERTHQHTGPVSFPLAHQIPDELADHAVRYALLPSGFPQRLRQRSVERNKGGPLPAQTMSKVKPVPGGKQIETENHVGNPAPVGVQRQLDQPLVRSDEEGEADQPEDDQGTKQKVGIFNLEHGVRVYARCAVGDHRTPTTEPAHKALPSNNLTFGIFSRHHVEGSGGDK